MDEPPIPMAYYPYTQAGGVTHLEVEMRVSGRALFGLQPYDPITFAAAFFMVVLVSLAASFLPARHAASIAPMQALSIE